MFQIRLHVTVNNEAIIIGEAQNEHVPGIDERMRIAPRPQLATGQGTLIFRVTDIVYILDNILPAAAAGGGEGEGGGHAAAASSPYPFPMKGEMSKVWLYLAPDNEETWQYMNRLTLFQAQQRAESGTAAGGGEEEEQREENSHP